MKISKAFLAIMQPLSRNSKNSSHLQPSQTSILNHKKKLAELETNPKLKKKTNQKK